MRYEKLLTNVNRCCYTIGILNSLITAIFYFVFKTSINFKFFPYLVFFVSNLTISLIFYIYSHIHKSEVGKINTEISFLVFNEACICATLLQFTHNFFAVGLSFITLDALLHFLFYSSVKINAKRCKTMEELKNYHKHIEYFAKAINLHKEDCDKVSRILGARSSLIKECEKTPILNKANISKMQIFSQVAERVLEYPYDKCDVPNDKYEKVIKSMQALREAVKNDNDALELLNIATFQTYTFELLNLFNKIVDNDLSKEPEYLEKLDLLTEKYEKYLDRMTEKIKTGRKSQVDITFNVLMKNMDNED